MVRVRSKCHGVRSSDEAEESRIKDRGKGSGFRVWSWELNFQVSDFSVAIWEVELSLI